MFVQAVPKSAVFIGRSGASCFSIFAVYLQSSKRIFRRIQHCLRLIERNIADSEKFKHLKQRIPNMSETHSRMVRKALLYQNMPIESFHIRDRDHTDAAKRMCWHIQGLTLRNVCLQLTFCCSLQAEKGNRTGTEISLDRTAGDVSLFAVGLQRAFQNCMFLQNRGFQQARRRVSAVESHKSLAQCIPLDLLLVQVSRDSIVNIQQCHRLFRQALTNVLRQCAVRRK